jgi:hypothetical protein
MEYSVKSVKATVALAVLALGVTFTQAACSKNDQEKAATNPALAAPVPAGMVRGKVLESMDAGSYTYAQIDMGTEQRWLAAPKIAVKVGDTVQATEGMAMPGFESKTLNRKFDVVYFVSGLDNLSNPLAAPASAAAKKDAPEASAAAQAATVAEDVAVSPVEEGKNIAELYANKDSYDGKEVTLRGKIVKYNANIMGSNFLHIRDGSGQAADGSNDLTVTTKDQATTGDTVVITGKVALAKDFGAGYSYPVLVEDAKVTVE